MPEMHIEDEVVLSSLEQLEEEQSQEFLRLLEDAEKKSSEGVPFTEQLEALQTILAVQHIKDKLSAPERELADIILHNIELTVKITELQLQIKEFSSQLKAPCTFCKSVNCEVNFCIGDYYSGFER